MSITPGSNRAPRTLAVIDIVLLCTANQCRSPMAEVLLADRLRALGVVAKVHSAGELMGGAPASAGSVRVMAARGLELTGHVSRQVTSGMLASADLIVAMGRRHLRCAVVLEPTSFDRTFTLKELVRRGGAVGPRHADQTLSAWLSSLHRGREIRDLLGEDPADDVADPMGSPDARYEETASELESLLDRVVDLAFASADRRESA